MLGLLLKYAVENLIDGKRTLPQVADLLVRGLKEKGFSLFGREGSIYCGYAMPRPQEIYACLNRYRRP